MTLRRKGNIKSRCPFGSGSVKNLWNQGAKTCPIDKDTTSTVEGDCELVQGSPMFFN